MSKYPNVPAEAPDAPWVSATEKPVRSDNVIKPDHYTQYKIEPITFIMENDLPFWMGNVIKYTMRADMKNGIEDLRKAIRYLEMRINQLEGKDVL